MAAPNETPVKRLQFWAAIAFTVAGLGFGAAMYLNRYAEAADVDRLSEHVESHESRLSHAETALEMLHDDLHWQREQTQRIADRVGAERVPPPQH